MRMQKLEADEHQLRSDRTFQHCPSSMRYITTDRKGVRPKAPPILTKDRKLWSYLVGPRLVIRWSSPCPSCAGGRIRRKGEPRSDQTHSVLRTVEEADELPKHRSDLSRA